MNDCLTAARPAAFPESRTGSNLILNWSPFLAGRSDPRASPPGADRFSTTYVLADSALTISPAGKAI